MLMIEIVISREEEIANAVQACFDWCNIVFRIVQFCFIFPIFFSSLVSRCTNVIMFRFILDVVSLWNLAEKARDKHEMRV